MQTRNSVRNEIGANGFSKIERVDHARSLMYVEGVTCPIKGVATFEDIEYVNRIKTWVRKPWTKMPTDVLSLRPCKLIFSIGIQDILFNFLCTELNFSISRAHKISKAIADVVEYDSAYRVRFQDLVSSTTKKALIEDPIGEMKRLKALSVERDYKKHQTTGKVLPSQKVGRLISLFTWVLRIPKVKRAFVAAIRRSNHDAMKFDECDIFWYSQRTDYKIGC